MFSAPKVKPVLLSPKAEPRNFHSTFSPKLNPTSTNQSDGFAYHKDLIKQSSPTNRDSKASHFLPKGAHSPIHYKTKRPVEIVDLGESDRLGLSSSIPASYEARPSAPYDTGNSQDIRTPFLSTRAGHSKDGEGGLDMEIESSNISYRTVCSGQKANNSSTSYLAEKVYSMRMKGPGLMGSLMPLSKSKAPMNGMSLSTKNGMTTPNKSGFRETDSYQSNTRSEIGYNTGDSSGLYKRGAAEGYKSAGKGINERKGINANTIHDSQMKRDSSWGKIKKAQTPLPKSDKRVPLSGDKGRSNGIGMHASPSQQKSRENNSQGMLKARLEVLVTRISTTWWQANQRNKRSTFLMLLDKWQQSENKLKKYLGRKGAVLKSKYFCLWQEFLLEVNLERQRVQQEKAEEMKIALADMFHDRKLLRKSFRLLKMADEILPPKTLSKSAGIHPKSAKSLRHPSISLQKSPVSQNKATTINSISAIKGHTPQSKSKTMQSKQKSISEKKINTKPAAKPAVTPKLQSPIENRSKSVGKILKDIRPQTANPLAQQNSVNDKLNISADLESPNRKDNSVNHSRYSKYPIKFYEPSEIEEATEMSQSPKKQNRTDKEIEGDIEKSPEKGKNAFDFILAEILHTSDSPRSPNVPRISIKTTSQLEIEPVPLEKSQSMPKSANFKTSPKKNDFMLKLDTVPKTTRGYSSPMKSDRDLGRGYSLTSRRTSKYEDPKFLTKSNRKTSESMLTPKKKIPSSRAIKTENTDGDEECDPLDKINLEKALNYRRKRMLQIPFVWFLAAAQQTKEELEEKNIIAEIHYENSLKIKSLSGLLEYFVKSFKENQLYKDYAENNLLKSCFKGWADQVPKTIKSQGYDSDGTYGEIVERFRFIVLTEKAIRVWKAFVASNKKPVVQKNRKY